MGQFAHYTTYYILRISALTHQFVSSSCQFVKRIKTKRMDKQNQVVRIYIS